MRFNSVRLENFLSFGPDSIELPLGALNVLIGANGSGKSNLIESFELLRQTPGEITRPIREGGGVRDWLWKGAKQSKSARITYTIGPIPKTLDLRYSLTFAEVGQRFEIIDEVIEDALPQAGNDKPHFYYQYQNGNPVLNVADGPRRLRKEDINVESSILNQRRDPDIYPELTQLGEFFSRGLRIYKDWTFGRYTLARVPQKTDIPSHWLESDCSNLALVLNNLRRDANAKRALLKALKVLFDGIEDYEVFIESGTAQLFLVERGVSIPAMRLSDGTLRYLCLLSILCHPSPPSVVCIEEPELGLHPDVIPTLAELLKSASERCQLIVTTHSEMLVDALSARPEDVLVCERGENGTVISRLDAEELKPWLENYRLGQLWMKGQIGGIRW